MLDSLNKYTYKWITHIDNIINTYNVTEHSITQIKPNEAGNKDNRLWVNWHLQNNSKHIRKHPELKDGDMVRFKLKPSIGTKGHEPKWSSTRHTIVGNSTNNEYYLPSVDVEYRKSNVFLRHELLKL